VDNGCKVKGMDMVMKPENQARNTLAIERTTKERGMVSIKMKLNSYARKNKSMRPIKRVKITSKALNRRQDGINSLNISLMS